MAAVGVSECSLLTCQLPAQMGEVAASPARWPRLRNRCALERRYGRGRDGGDDARRIALLRLFTRTALGVVRGGMDKKKGKGREKRGREDRKLTGKPLKASRSFSGTSLREQLPPMPGATHLPPRQDRLDASRGLPPPNSWMFFSAVG